MSTTNRLATGRDTARMAFASFVFCPMSLAGGFVAITVGSAGEAQTAWRHSLFQASLDGIIDYHSPVGGRQAFSGHSISCNAKAPSHCHQIGRCFPPIHSIPLSAQLSILVLVLINGDAISSPCGLCVALHAGWVESLATTQDSGIVLPTLPCLGPFSNCEALTV